MQVWDQRCSESVGYVYGAHVCGDTLDIDAEHGHLLCGSWRKNNTVQIYDLRNGPNLIRDVFKAKCPMMVRRDYLTYKMNTFYGVYIEFI